MKIQEQAMPIRSRRASRLAIILESSANRGGVIELDELELGFLEPRDILESEVSWGRPVLSDVLYETRDLTRYRDRKTPEPTGRETASHAAGPDKILEVAQRLSRLMPGSIFLWQMEDGEAYFSKVNTGLWRKLMPDQLAKVATQAEA